VSERTPTPEGRAKRRSGGAARDGAVASVYTVEVARQTIDVSLVADAVLIDGVVTPVELRSVPGSPIQLLRIGDAVYELVTRTSGPRGSYSVAVDGQRLEVEALDERSRAVRSLRAATAVSTGPEPLRAPMPGLVTRVLVGPGDTVTAGTSLVVMEAMKMENELRAKVDGTVRDISIQPGTPVEKGTILVTWH
jgi:biotin carboxyl carrier protein